MEEVISDLEDVPKVIVEEIIRGILKSRNNLKTSLAKIERLLADLIGENTLTKFKRHLEVYSHYSDATRWKKFLKTIPGTKYSSTRKLSYDFKKKSDDKECLEPRKDKVEILNISVVEYKKRLLAQMIITLFDGDLKDVNFVDLNGNTTLHLLASLPTESGQELLDFQTDLMKLLVEKSPDCSIKNAQDMTALHIIAGNYLLDPNNNFVLSKQRGLNCKENTLGRYKKLSCVENVIKKPFKIHGRDGNSILHEWVLHSILEKVEDEEEDREENKIGEWIISSADISPNTVNHRGCTPLHYAFTGNLIEFLCKNGARTKHPNVDGDTPLIYIMKHGILPTLVKNVLPNGWELQDTLSSKFNIQLSDPNLCGNLNNICVFQPIFTLKTLEEHEFDFFEYDSSKRNCLDYFLLFINVFVENYLEDETRQLYLVQVIKEGISKLIKNCNIKHRQATECMEKALSEIISAFFTCKLGEHLNNILYECAKELLEAGVDPNMHISCDDGKNLLRFSCEKAIVPLHIELLTLLCEYGADQGVKNKDGMTPIDILSQRGLNEAVTILKSTKPKQRVKFDIQSQRYKSQLDHLSRQLNPRTIKEYRYDREAIGKGSMGCVYLAINEKSGKEVALKRVLKTSYHKEIAAEIRALNRLEQTQNVVNFYSLAESEDFYFIALELMDGDLEDLVKAKVHFLQNQDQMCNLAKDILRGMEFLHSQNIIHRDLKPGNILYRENPNFCLKLADFGLAKHLNVTSTCQTSVCGTSSTSLCGTRGWMAPELVTRTQREPTKESDMFALGLVLHFLFSKAFHPFHSSSSSLLEVIATDALKPHELEANICDGNVQIHQDLNPEQNDLVIHLLNNDPRERPRSQGLIKQHCYFWSNLKKVTFMWKVGDQPEVTRPSNFSSSTFESELQNSAFGLSTINWNVPISPLYQELGARRRYNTSSVLDLIRFFRNCYAHYEDISPDRKVEILNDQFFVIFPEFFLTVWKEVCKQGWVNPGSGKDMIIRVLEEMN